MIHFPAEISLPPARANSDREPFWLNMRPSAVGRTERSEFRQCITLMLGDAVARKTRYGLRSV